MKLEQGNDLNIGVSAWAQGQKKLSIVHSTALRWKRCPSTGHLHMAFIF
jgi:hypothetical protein